MDKKKEKDQLAGTYLPWPRSSLVTNHIIAKTHQKHVFQSPNPEGLRFFILTFLPRAITSRCCSICDAITDPLVDGQNSNTTTVIPTDNLTRGFPFLYEPRFLSYSPVSSSTISKIRS